MSTAAATAAPSNSPRFLTRVLHALLGSTLFGISAARAQEPVDMYVTEEIGFSGYVAGLTLPVDDSPAVRAIESGSYLPVATPDGFFVEEDMDAAAYRAMFDEIQLQQYVVVSSISPQQPQQTV